jgi:hypothetical protein
MVSSHSRLYATVVVTEVRLQGSPIVRTIIGKSGQIEGFVSIVHKRSRLIDQSLERIIDQYFFGRID